MCYYYYYYQIIMSLLFAYLFIGKLLSACILSKISLGVAPITIFLEKKLHSFNYLCVLALPCDATHVMRVLRSQLTDSQYLKWPNKVMKYGKIRG